MGVKKTNKEQTSLQQQDGNVEDHIPYKDEMMKFKSEITAVTTNKTVANTINKAF